VIGYLGKDYKAALSAIERAVSLNPSSAAAFYWAAIIHASSGNFAAVTANADRALRLSPFDPVAFVAHLALGHAAFPEARYSEAASHYAKVELNPGFRSSQVFEYGVTGTFATKFKEGARLLDLPE
jgi:adenylate cyclase